MGRTWLRRARRTTPVLLGLVAIAGLLAFTAAPAGAVGTLDQSQESGTVCQIFDPELAETMAGQTFTAGITGDLDQVDVFIARGNEATEPPFVVEIQTVAGGVPSGTVLATTSVPAASAPSVQAGFVQVPIGPVPVTAGTQYAIVVSRPGSAFVVCGEPSNPYAGGAFSIGGPDGWQGPSVGDLAFRTYVTAPPPPPDPEPEPSPCQLIRLTLQLFGQPIVICI